MKSQRCTKKLREQSNKVGILDTKTPVQTDLTSNKQLIKKISVGNTSRASQVNACAQIPMSNVEKIPTRKKVSILVQKLSKNPSFKFVFI